MLCLSLTAVNFNSHWSSQHPLLLPPIIEISCLFVGEHRNVLAVSVPHSKLDKDVRWIQTPNYPSMSTSYKFSNMALDFKTNVSMCMHVYVHLSISVLYASTILLHTDAVYRDLDIQNILVCLIQISQNTVPVIWPQIQNGSCKLSMHHKIHLTKDKSKCKTPPHLLWWGHQNPCLVNWQNW